MDLQMCSACSSPIPARSSIKLKTCQHSFCVPCLKYSLMYGGTPDLQCPFPLGTFECGAKPNEAEVQYILEYDDDERQDQDADVNGGNSATIGMLEETLDRVLSIGVDEFRVEPREELPSVKELHLNDSLVHSNGINRALETVEQVSLVMSSSGSDQLLEESCNDIVDADADDLSSVIFSPDCGSDLLQGTDSSTNIQPNLTTAEDYGIAALFKEPDEAVEEAVESKSDQGQTPIEPTEGLEQFCSEQGSTETEKDPDEPLASCSDIGNDTKEVESSSSMESVKPVKADSDISNDSSTIAKDESKGAIPKARKSPDQEQSKGSAKPPTSDIPQNSSEDQDLALTMKLQEEESKIDMDLLLAISDANLPPNMEPFECPVCYGQFKPYEGVTLTFCFHSFCKPCLSESVKHSDELEVTCPALVDGDVKCTAIVQDSAVRDLLTEEDFRRFQDRCLQTAEAVIPNTMHCHTPNCRGWVELIGDVEFFDCSICLVRNCVWCKAIHGDQSCEDYQATIQRKDDDIKSEATLKTMVETREGMRCPKCGVMITKIAGCDYMTCTTCKTGICWPTRGPRWVLLARVTSVAAVDVRSTTARGAIRSARGVTRRRASKTYHLLGVLRV